jgi:hypothetical protein
MLGRIRGISTFLVLITAQTAFSQRGEVHFSDAKTGPTERDSTTIDSQRALLMPARDIQSEAFAYCMATTKAAHKLMGRMPDGASYWRVRRNGSYNISAVSEKRDQLQSALAGKWQRRTNSFCS